MYNPDTVFFNYTNLLGKHSDLILALKVLVRAKLPLQIIDGKVYINSTDKPSLSEFKSLSLTIQEPGFTSLNVNWSESENNPLVTKTLAEAGFSFYYMGEDGSWLATPTYLLVHKNSLPEIKSLAKQGYFSQVQGALWNLR